jgi:hypothetical protein
MGEQMAATTEVHGGIHYWGAGRCHQGVEQIVPSKSFWNMLDTLGGNILVYKDQLP